MECRSARPHDDVRAEAESGGRPVVSLRASQRADAVFVGSDVAGPGETQCPTSLPSPARQSAGQLPQRGACSLALRPCRLPPGLLADPGDDGRAGCLSVSRIDVREAAVSGLGDDGRAAAHGGAGDSAVVALASAQSRRSLPPTTQDLQPLDAPHPCGVDDPAPARRSLLPPPVRVSDACTVLGCKGSASIALSRRCHRVPPKCTAAAKNRLPPRVPAEYGGTGVHNRGGS